MSSYSLNHFKGIFQEKTLLPFLLLVGLIHGLIYMFLLPPWQHYDEPGQFEYVWMIAHSNTIPDVGMYDNGIRLQILQSMKAHNFFNNPGLKELEKIAATLDPVWIGVPQVGDPPLYYLLAALPVWALNNQPIEIQMYAARCVSLLLWLAVLAVSVFFAREVTANRHPLRWLLPLSLAFLPAFAEHSVAVNNDVAATLVYSLILLFGFRLIQNGYRLVDVLMLVLLSVLSYFTKASIWLSVFVILLAFFFALFRKRSKVLAFSILFFVAVAGIFVVFEFNDAALWFRESSQVQPTKAETDYGLAYQVVDDRADRSNALYQIVVPQNQSISPGSVMTAGAWIWGSGHVEVYPPSLMVLTNSYQRVFLRPTAVPLKSTPTFYSVSYQIPAGAVRLYVVLEPFVQSEKTGIVYYQNPFLVLGEYNGNFFSQLSDLEQNEAQVTQAQDNLIRNTDASATWPKFRPELINKMYAIDPRMGEAANWTLYGLDLKATFWYTKNSIEVIFRSFWGKFGWGHVSLVGDKPYRLPFLFSVIGAFTGLYTFVRKYPHSKTYLLAWSAFAIMCVFFYCWFTGISSQAFVSKPIYPDARYFFPVVFLFMGIMTAGWISLIHILPQKLREFGYIAYFLYFLYLDILAIYSVHAYYGG